MDTKANARPLGGGAGRIEITGQTSSIANVTSIADRLLNRLEGVKSTGPDQWVALCPAHEDQSPSLSIRDAGDRLLLRCFAGCSTEAVVAALGLQMADLFASSPSESRFRSATRCEHRLQIPRRDLEAALQHELHILLQVVGNRVSSRQLARDKKFRVLRPEWMPVPEGFWDRELQATRRTRRMLTMLYGPELDARRAA
jgi:hypothetical protein